MAANVTKRLWEIGDIVDVLEAWEAKNSPLPNIAPNTNWTLPSISAPIFFPGVHAESPSQALTEWFRCYLIFGK